MSPNVKAAESQAVNLYHFKQIRTSDHRRFQSHGHYAMMRDEKESLTAPYVIKEYKNNIQENNYTFLLGHINSNLWRYARYSTRRALSNAFGVWRKQLAWRWRENTTFIFARTKLNIHINIYIYIYIVNYI